MFIEKCYFDEILYDRSGSLIVDYDVIINDEFILVLIVVFVVKDFVLGMENVMYDGKFVLVLLVVFCDLLGINGR